MVRCEMLSVERLVAVARQKWEEAAGRPIVALWYTTSTERESLRAGIEAARGDLPLVALVLRSRSFENPNAIHSDLHDLICESRSSFESDTLVLPDHNRAILLLLISRTDFAAPQLSSPVELPPWFPQHGGEAVPIYIEDLIKTADGPLNAPEASVGAMCESIHRCETALVTRLNQLAARDTTLGQAFFAQIANRRAPEDTYADFLERARRNLQAVQNPSAYRPSVKQGSSLTGQILSLYRRTTPDELPAVAKDLANAMGANDQSAPFVRDSIWTVLMRSTGVETPSARFARNVMATIYAASQFATAAAHADAYPPYQIMLLRALSYNLRCTLDELTAAVEILIRGTDSEGVLGAGDV
jgi:hypothetical protein